MKKFTEKQTRDFYNEDDIVYRSFWDKSGNCHWGYFPKEKTPFARAMIELNIKMLKLSDIDSTSRVLDLGCGNGNNTFFLNEKTRAEVVGIDLSDARIKNADIVLQQKKAHLRRKIKFFQASATQLDFQAGAFTHVWSQATIYHVHDKRKALKEVHRVLKKNGMFVFDDLIKPSKRISKQAEKLVYERLLFDTDYSFVSYQQELEKIGFRVLYAEDISMHYALSYWKLADILKEKIAKSENREFHNKYRKLIHAYQKTWTLVQKGEIGWALFACKKI